MSGDGNIYPGYRQAPQFALGVTIAAFPAYTTLFDTGSPAAGAGSGMLPANRGYLHARSISDATTPATVLVEIRHFADTTLIGIEEFGLINPALGEDQDGGDFRTVFCGYPIQPRGNRILVAATATSEQDIDWVMRWGEYETSKVTQVGGYFAYAADQAAIVRARCGFLRPMKSLIVQATCSAFAGTIPTLTGLLLRAGRTAVGPFFSDSATRFTITPVVARVDVESAVAGIGADAAIDEFGGFDGFQLETGLVAAVSSGTIHWRATMMY